MIWRKYTAPRHLLCVTKAASVFKNDRSTTIHLVSDKFSRPIARQLIENGARVGLYDDLFRDDRSELRSFLLSSLFFDDLLMNCLLER